MGTEKALEEIKGKLRKFLSRYYSSMLVKGGILFLATGGVYFLITLLLESLLWLSPGWRTAAFYVFVVVEGVLFVRYIVIPLLYLFRLKRGLNNEAASRIIGDHFPEVGDKLLNLLQLAGQPEQTELLLAGIAQKSADLKGVPFHRAVNLSANKKYLKYLLFPLGLIILAWVSGQLTALTGSYQRIVDHRTAYTPPAPFEFLILNDSLKALSGKAFTLEVATEGKIRPEMVKMVINDHFNYLRGDENGGYKITLNQVKEPVRFYLEANGVKSREYVLDVVMIPSLLHVELSLDYPKYTGKGSDVVKGSGNATVPEGTRIMWKVNTEHADEVELLSKDTVVGLERKKDSFFIYQSVLKKMPYVLAASNAELKQYEKLNFTIEVIPDQLPRIATKMLNEDDMQRDIYGEISDDYGFKKLELVYYPERDPEKRATVLLQNPEGNFERFRHSFPGNLSLEEGENYQFYYSVTDNDGLRGGKTAVSRTWSYYVMSKAELREEKLKEQKQQIESIDNSIQKLEEQEEELGELQNINRQKEALSYNDQRRMSQFLKRQQQQEEMMKSFSEEMKKNLEEMENQSFPNTEDNRLLQERLERQRLEVEKNQRLLKELEEYGNKLEKESLTQRLEELSKNQQNNKRNLEQLLELTKRYFVQAKTQQLADKLNELADKQLELAKDSVAADPQTQQELNRSFEEMRKELDSLFKENNGLKKPMDLDRDQKREESAAAEQQKALEKLQEQQEEEGDQAEPQENKAGENQQKAGNNVRKIAQSMSSSMNMEGAQMIQEDAAMLRQILDNLVVITFDQEDLMQEMGQFDQNNPNLPESLREQNALRALFEHVDDSLFALSLRRPELNEVVNKNITDVYYNMDKSLERFADNQYYQAITHQQYTLTAANNLADFLSNMLDDLQNAMMGSGSGEGSFQLPDIIQSQQQLNQQMQQGMQHQGKEGEQEQEGEGDKKEGEGQEKGKGSNGNEGDMEQLYEIYKQQQQLRMALEKQLEEMQGAGEKAFAQQLSREMEAIERQLLERGMSPELLRSMQRLEHRLLQLEQAEQLQGQKEERESQTNLKNYTQSSSNQLPEDKDSTGELELLQRQVLPLREIYKQKVQRYFKENDRL